MVVYNYGGDVYASGESRMLAEMGDTSFRLGNVVEDSYEVVFFGETMQNIAMASCNEAIAGCSDCTHLLARVFQTSKISTLRNVAIVPCGMIARDCLNLLKRGIAGVLKHYLAREGSHLGIRQDILMYELLPAVDGNG